MEEGDFLTAVIKEGDDTVDLDPDDEDISQSMGERNEKYSYVPVRFGAELPGKGR